LPTKVSDFQIRIGRRWHSTRFDGL
jgi:hypothetical protein